MQFSTLFVRSVLANATASEWMDCVVEQLTDSSLVLRTVDGAERLELPAPSDLALAPLEPVAVHRRYGVLAAGAGRRELAFA